MTSNQQALIGWIHNGAPCWGIGQELKDNFWIVQWQDKTSKIPQHDIALEISLKNQPPATELLEKAQQAKTQMNVFDIWQHLQPHTQQTFTPIQLAKQLYAQTVTPSKIIALWLLAWEHPAYFAKLGRTLFRIRTAQEMQAELSRQAEKQYENQTLQQIEQSAKAVLSGQLPAENWPETHPAIVQTLRHWLSLPEQSDPKVNPTISRSVLKYIEQIYTQANVRWPLGWFIAKILHYPDPWLVGEPLLNKQQQWLTQAAQQPVEGIASTQTLTPQTQLWAIDQAHTEDRDDAIGCIALPDGTLLVEIALADITASMGKQTEWFDHLSQIATSVYLPTQTIPLLPNEIGLEKHSLTPTVARPVFLISVSIDQGNGQIKHQTITRGLVTIDQIATYDDVDAQSCPQYWSQLKNLSALLFANRLANGAERIEKPDVFVEVRGQHPSKLITSQPWQGSRAVVRECMILANTVIARHLKQARLAAPFRSQERQQGILHPVQTRIKPAAHDGLGVDVYVYASSPIRRFVDILAQCQLASLWQHPTLNTLALKHWLKEAEKSSQKLQQWMQSALTYWKLRYLEANPTMPLYGEIVHEQEDVWTIQVQPIDLRTTLPTTKKTGRYVIELKAIDAERGEVHFSWA